MNDQRRLEELARDRQEMIWDFRKRIAELASMESDCQEMMNYCRYEGWIWRFFDWCRRGMVREREELRALLRELE